MVDNDGEYWESANRDIRGRRGVQTDIFSKNPFDATGSTHVHEGIEHLPDGTKKPFSVVRDNK
ncbi:MAG: hypothetical protein HY556_02140 [Euryarchaeota archaeon]|nr:hypothetical protein [Euryarchaeota archaeon]